MTYLLLFISNLWAGDTNYEISCASASKRTTVQASIPGCCGMSLDYTIDGKTLQYYNDYVYDKSLGDTVHKRNADIQVVGEFTSEKPNFAFTISDIEKQLVFNLIAMPSTVAVKPDPSGHTGSFNALIVGKDPRSSDISPTIEVQCTYKFLI